MRTIGEDMLVAGVCVGCGVGVPGDGAPMLGGGAVSTGGGVPVLGFGRVGATAPEGVGVGGLEIEGGLGGVMP